MLKFTDKLHHILISVGTAILMFFFMLFALKIQEKAHRQEMERADKREIRKDALFLELAKTERFKIENTFTIKKPKKGSTVDVVIDNKMDAEFQKQAENLDKLINEFSKPDSIPVRKTFFQKLFGK